MRIKKANRKRKRILAGVISGWMVFQCFLMPCAASGGDSVPVFSGQEAVTELDASALSAKSAVLADGDGTVLFEKNGYQRLPMASTTKIMTALVVLEHCETDALVKIPREAVGVEGSSVYLYEGELLTVEELLYAMLLESANDAATALALYSAGTIDAFADYMNEKAEALSLADTHFENPHGLSSDGHYTTAADLAALTAYALDNPVFRKIVSTYRTEIPLRRMCDGGKTEGNRLLVNHNRLLKGLDGCIGVKTGYTMEAGRCLVSAAERDGCRLICVTLSAPDDWNDHRAMYDYGYARYESVCLTEKGEQYLALPCVGAVTASPDGIAMIGVNNTDAVRITLSKNGHTIRKTVEVPRFLYAPVSAGDRVGQVVYRDNGELLAVVPLYAVTDAALYIRPRLWQRIFSVFKNKTK